MDSTRASVHRGRTNKHIEPTPITRTPTSRTNADTEDFFFLPPPSSPTPTRAYRAARRHRPEGMFLPPVPL
eukprot:4301743-Pyramimonas_sp.AAC.1